MKRDTTYAERVVLKLAQLPPERIAEVADFVDFLAQREQEKHGAAVIAQMSGPALEKIWDNQDDAEYDNV